MAAKYYSPQIRRDLVSLLYHEAKRQRKPMTKLVDALLREALRGPESFSVACERFADAPNGTEVTAGFLS
jgi:hypothetical protein